MVKFRVVSFGAPDPNTGYRFYVQWYVRRWKWGVIPYMSWENFRDPTRNDEYQGYKTLEDANVAIRRYKLNMTPQYHYYEG